MALLPKTLDSHHDRTYKRRHSDHCKAEEIQPRVTRQPALLRHLIDDQIAGQTSFTFCILCGFADNEP
jgi:hypothetical protein